MNLVVWTGQKIVGKLGCFFPENPMHPDIENLRQRRPELFTAPDFWLSRLKDIDGAVREVKTGTVERIGQSAGGSKLYAFNYGELEPMASTATISSAMASDRPEAFYDPQKRTRPSLSVLGSIHGGETEGIAFCLSLIRLLETGRDASGQERPALLEKIRRLRLSVVPCLNPDGRSRAGISHLNGAALEDLFLVQQGLLADGSPFFGRKVKEIQPIPKETMRLMGGYYNDEGVNLQHDDFFGPRQAPENQAIRDFFRREVPDAFLTFHSHGGAPAILTPDAFLSPGTQRKQVEMAGFILSKLHAAGIAFIPPDQIVTPPWSFYFQTWLHHMTGATPLLFEFCHGMEMNPMTLEKIHESGFVTFEGWVDYCLAFGARPRANELFGSIRPA